MDRTVLVVEDDARIAEVIAEQLGEEGFTVCLARSVSQALALLSERAPDLAVLDVALPDGSGFEICRRIREGGERFDSAIPVLMLSGRTDEVDVLRGFQRGADDYVRKPFSVPELMARIDVLMSRGRRRASGVLRIGRLEVDTDARLVRYAGTALELSGKEYDLLVLLASDPGVVRTKQELLRRIWDAPSTLQTRTVDSHASRLRRKLIVAGAPGDPVVNAWGRGYRLEIAGA